MRAKPKFTTTINILSLMTQFIKMSLTFGDISGFQIRRNVVAEVSADPPQVSARNQSFLIQVESRQTQPYRVFRFYSIVARAYMGDNGKGSMLSANNRNPLGKEVEWEWIAFPTYSNIFLRNRQTRRYLCFNSNGRPTMLRTAQIRRCLIKVNALVQTVKHLQKEESLRSYSTATPHFRNGTSKKPSSIHITEKDASWTSSAIELGSFAAKRTKTVVVSAFDIVWLSLAVHSPRWRVRFCRNGAPFAYNRPIHDRCQLPQLSSISEMLILCPQIPQPCRVACVPKSIDGVYSHVQSKRILPTCTFHCLQALSCKMNANVNIFDFSGTIVKKNTINRSSF
ncbi:unnamed protein product [Dicrocoelium dendriticum]|nr:unnamed protein product [Dicrocoelium dendriticum]